MAQLVQTLALLLLVGVLSASGYEYEITVATGYYFNPTEGSIKLTVGSQNSHSNEFRLVE